MQIFLYFCALFMSIKVKIGLLLVLLTASFSFVRADERMYHCEFGIEGGCGYYMGDAADLPFKNVREMYGANFRYRFDQRWGLQVQGITQRLVGTYNKENGTVIVETPWKNQLINLDVAAEFNFFRFGAKCYDPRVKPLTPYITLGVGMCIMPTGTKKFAAYIPFGVGLKWKFAERMNLQIQWQNNWYFSDALEGVPELDNAYRLNGSNILNNDLTGTISVGLGFEFAKEKRVCRICKN